MNINKQKGGAERAREKNNIMALVGKQCTKMYDFLN